MASDKAPDHGVLTQPTPIVHGSPRSSIVVVALFAIALLLPLQSLRPPVVLAICDCRFFANTPEIVSVVLKRAVSHSRVEALDSDIDGAKRRGVLLMAFATPG